MLRSVLVLTAALATAPLAANANTYWDVQSVNIQEVQESAVAPLLTTDCSTLNLHSLADGTIGWNEIVAIGEKVWTIIEAGRPVVNVTTPPVVSALPRGLECWSDLDSWKAPKTKSYEVVYKNGFGMEVVKFRFRLHYTYGGGHKGTGQYLANVTVLPAELNVLWGFTFDANVEVNQALNLGTFDNPMAGLELNLKWKVSTVVKETQNSFHFFVQGDGLSNSAN